VFFTEARKLQEQAFLKLEQGFQEETICDHAMFSLVTASRAQLESFLNEQAYLLNHRIHLIEVFAGQIANTSKTVEKAKGNAIRIGLAWGQDLSTAVNRALLLELIKYVRPEHVIMAWQCTSVAGFSQLNYMKHEQPRQSVDAARELVGHWINMFCIGYMIQHLGRRFCNILDLLL
jgi:hypothetical protein